VKKEKKQAIILTGYWHIELELVFHITWTFCYPDKEIKFIFTNIELVIQKPLIKGSEYLIEAPETDNINDVFIFNND
jgi:hypothetical protein